MSARRLFIPFIKSRLVTGEVLDPKSLFRNKWVERRMMEIKKTSLVKNIVIAKEYCKSEITPPKVSDIKHIQSDLVIVKNFFKDGSYKNTTIKDAWLYLLVTIEVVMWFYMGEVIGKRHIVGYKV